MSYVKDLPVELEEETGAVVEVLRFDVLNKPKDFIFKLGEDYFCTVVPHSWSSKVKAEIVEQMDLYGSVKICMRKSLGEYMGKVAGSLVFISFKD